jgi:hypothetical protein
LLLLKLRGTDANTSQSSERNDRVILMHTLFYANEVRKEPESKADPAIVADKEPDLAVKLIEALATKFEPEKFRDKYREQVEALIAAKIQGREPASASAIRPRSRHHGGPEEKPCGRPPTRAEEITAEPKPERRTNKRRAKKG